MSYNNNNQIQLTNDEYALIMQPLLFANRSIKSGTELSKQVGEAIQILKQSAKGNNNNKATPQGGSMSMSKDEKHSLFQMFGLC